MQFQLENILKLFQQNCYLQQDVPSCLVLLSVSKIQLYEIHNIYVLTGCFDWLYIRNCALGRTQSECISGQGDVGGSSRAQEGRGHA